MNHRMAPAPERGAVTLVTVLVLMLVMLLGALTFGRVAESGTLVTGNVSLQERALQVSELGVNTAFDQVKALASEDQNIGSWYFATPRQPDADGLPGGVSWDRTPTVAAGAFELRYVVERLCTATPVTAPLRQCLVKQQEVLSSRKAGSEAYEPPTGREFRITVRISGPRSSQTFVQALVTKG